MTQAIFLGFLQGVTEFLPVSSSGHLVLFQHLFGIVEPELFFDTVLHFATMMATIIFFRKDIADIFRKISRGEQGGKAYLAFVVFALIPTAILGFTVAKNFSSIFSSMMVVRISFLATAAILMLPRFLPLKKERELNGSRAFLIGLAQGISVIPGLSRSGSTIVVGVLSGVNFQESFRFSFILSIPAIMGAMTLNAAEGILTTSFPFSAVAGGFIAAFFSGYLSLAILKRVIIGMKLHVFGYYLFALFLFTVIFL